MSVDSATAASWAAPAPSAAAENTRASVINALKSLTTLSDKNIETFLQGSYANHTNVRSDSDVDIVVMSHRTFYHNIDRLPLFQQQQFHAAYDNGTYGARQLRADVQRALTDYFGSNRVESHHNKCLRVLARDGYLDADVVPAFVYRRYNSFSSLNTSDYTEGTVIFPANGAPRILNFPKEHKKHGTVKHQVTSEKFKPTVRQLKRLKHKAVSDNLLVAKKLPGYLLECLTYNIPHGEFVADDRVRMANALLWLADADYGDLDSVDNIHKLFRTDPGNFDAEEARAGIHKLVTAFVN